MGKELWVGWMRQFQLYGLLKREPRNRRMLVRRLPGAVSRAFSSTNTEHHDLKDTSMTITKTTP